MIPSRHKSAGDTPDPTLVQTMSLEELRNFASWARKGDAFRLAALLEALAALRESWTEEAQASVAPRPGRLVVALDADTGSVQFVNLTDSKLGVDENVFATHNQTLHWRFVARLSPQDAPEPTVLQAARQSGFDDAITAERGRVRRALQEWRSAQVQRLATEESSGRERLAGAIAMADLALAVVDGEDFRSLSASTEPQASE